MRRNTGPVTGWCDCSPFFAAARTAFWNSPIEASFKMKRSTPSLTRSRMSTVLRDAICSRFAPRTRVTAFLADTVFPELSPHTLHHAPFRAEDAATISVPRSAPLLANLGAYSIWTIHLSGIAPETEKGTSPPGGGTATRIGWCRDLAAKVAWEAKPERRSATRRVERRRTSEDRREFTHPNQSRRDVTGREGRRRGDSSQFPAGCGARASQGCCGRGSSQYQRRG